MSWVMKMGNIEPRVGFEPTPLVFRDNVLIITPSRVLVVITLSTPTSLCGSLPQDFVCLLLFYRLVTVRTHGDLIVLPHWGTRLPAPWLAIPFSLIIPYLILIMQSLARKRQVSISKSLVWLDPWGSNPAISQNERKMLYSFGHLA